MITTLMPLNICWFHDMPRSNLLWLALPCLSCLVHWQGSRVKGEFRRAPSCEGHMLSWKKDLFYVWFDACFRSHPSHHSRMIWGLKFKLAGLCKLRLKIFVLDSMPAANYILDTMVEVSFRYRVSLCCFSVLRLK